MGGKVQTLFIGYQNGEKKYQKIVVKIDIWRKSIGFSFFLLRLHLHNKKQKKKESRPCQKKSQAMFNA